MTYFIDIPQLGALDASSVDSLAPGAVNLVGTNKSGRYAKLGHIATGYEDTNYTGCTFIYLQGNTSVTAGTLVQWDVAYQATTLASTANTGRPFAVALTTVTSGQYGWFLVQGKVAVLKTAIKVSPDSRMWISGTAGRFFATATSGKQLLGARTVNSATIGSTTSTVNCIFQFPHVQGQTI